MTVHEIIILARKYVMQGKAPMQSSAELCLSDAIKLYDNGALGSAKNRAINSLAYTVGIGHPDYIRASR
jgi:uncharacterized protein (UPF0332 family)